MTQLRALGSRLLNIHGQHDGQQLLDEEQHLLYLDSFGRTEPLLTAYREKYAKLTDIRRQMHALQMDEAEKARRMDTLRYQIQELQRAKLRPGEEEELTSRRNLLRNGERFSAAMEGANYCLNGSENSDGAVSQVTEAENALSGVRQLGDVFSALLHRLAEVRHELYDIAETVRDMKEQFDFSPAELDEIEGRLDEIYRLKRNMVPPWRICWLTWNVPVRNWTNSICRRYAAAASKKYHAAGDVAKQAADRLTERGNRLPAICREGFWQNCGIWI